MRSADPADEHPEVNAAPGPRASLPEATASSSAAPTDEVAHMSLVEHLPADAHTEIARHLDPADLGRVATTCTELSRGDGPYVQRRMALQHERLVQQSVMPRTFFAIDELLQHVQRVGGLPASVSSAELAALRSDALRSPQPGSVAAAVVAQPLVSVAIRSMERQSRWVNLGRYIGLLPDVPSPEAIQTMMPWLLQKVQQQPAEARFALATNMLHWLTKRLPPQERAGMLLNAVDLMAPASPSARAAVMHAAIRFAWPLVPANEQHAVIEQLLRRSAALPPEQQISVLSGLLVHTDAALPAGTHAQALDVVLAEASRWDNPALWTRLPDDVSTSLRRLVGSARGGAQVVPQVIERLAALPPAVRGPAMAEWLGSHRGHIPDGNQAALAAQVLQDLPLAAETERAAALTQIWSVVSNGMRTVTDPDLVNALTAASSLLPAGQRASLIRDQLQSTFGSRSAEVQARGVSPVLFGALRAQLAELPEEHRAPLAQLILQCLPRPGSARPVPA